MSEPWEEREPPAPSEEPQELTARLPRALREQAQAMPREQVRALVDHYYVQQGQRIAGEGRIRAFEQGRDEAQTVTGWLLDRFRVGEDAAKTAITYWAKARPDPTAWAMSQYGIGPILAAGLECHIDIHRAPTVGHIWRFAGLDPTLKWAKGQKRPYNASLKVLAWKIGDSMVRFHGREECYYGHVYAERKAYEDQRNRAGGNESTATADLGTRQFRESGTKACYEGNGTKCQHADPDFMVPHLPPGRIDQRARRYAAKLFLAHWHEVAYKAAHGMPPPLPYPVAQLGHAHVIQPPGT